MRPIRVYLLILVLGAMLPGALLTGILVWRAIANNRAMSERRLLESARVDASALDREFDRSISILHALATSPALDDTNLDAFDLEGRDQIARADSARREAEEANKTKDQFLAVLGHELRNPLAPALTALELMKIRDSSTCKRGA